MSRGTRYYLHRGTIVSALVGTALLIISATTPHFYVGDRSAWTYIDKPKNSSPTHEVSESQPSGDSSEDFRHDGQIWSGISTVSPADLLMSPLPYANQNEETKNNEESLTAFKVHNSLQIVAILISCIGTHYGLYGAVRSSYRAFLVLPIATIFATGFSVYGMTFFFITVGQQNGESDLSGFSFVGFIVAQALLLFSGIIGIIYSLLPKY